MDQLIAARIQTVRDHMRLECESDWDGVIATFVHPRYELYGAGTVFDGEEAVRGYFAASRVPFPDQANEIIAIGAEGDTVLVEFWLTGTHLGPLRTPKGEIAPTGKAFRVRMMASFEFAPAPQKLCASGPISTGAPSSRRSGWAERIPACRSTGARSDSLPVSSASRPNGPFNNLLEVSVLHQRGALNPSLRSRV
jgi:SnoaL-like domain